MTISVGLINLNEKLIIEGFIMIIKLKKNAWHFKHYIISASSYTTRSHSSPS